MPLIDGKSLATKIRDQLKNEVAALDLVPKLNVLLVGDDPASVLYVALKKKAADEVGIAVEVHHLEATVTDDELVALIEKWNSDSQVHAILVQLPLPAGHDENRVISAMDPNKDADGFHPANVEKLLSGEPTIVPPVHEGILRLINETPLRLAGASAVILANSDVFAAPLKRLLTTAGLSVEVFNADNLNKELLLEADLVVIAIGRLRFLRSDMTKPGAVIIDVGTNKTADGKTRGDANTEAYLADQPETWITPVPGGVGPMTIAMLLANVVKLVK